MSVNSIKFKSFEYLVLRFIEWDKELNIQSTYQYSFSKLKVTKILFFVSAVNATPTSKGLLDIFDNFWAMPFGHVESDIYDSLNESNLFHISKEGLKTKDADIHGYFDGIDVAKLNLAYQTLKKKNPQLINLHAFDLVELSHAWQSWKIIFNLAKSQGKLSLKIPINLIQSERKFYNLEFAF